MTGGEIESLLDRLSGKRECLILMKANKGYSAVVLSSSEYISIVAYEHYNGETIDEALHELAERRYG